MKLTFVHYAYVQYSNNRALCDIAERAVKKGERIYRTVLEFLNNLCGGYAPSRNRVVVPARQATQPGGIGSLESILGLLQSLKIRAQDSAMGVR